MKTYVKENEYNLFVVPVLESESRLMDKNTKRVLKKQKGLDNRTSQVIFDIPKGLKISYGLLNTNDYDILSKAFSEEESLVLKNLNSFLRY